MEVKDKELAEGWLNRQMEIVRRNVAEWPAYLKRAAGIADVPETAREAWDESNKLEEFLTEQIHVFNLVFDQQITPRKAIESLACYRAGNIPALPAETPEIWTADITETRRLEHGQNGESNENEGTRTSWQVGGLRPAEAEAIKAKIAAGEAGQYEASILWQELERLGAVEVKMQVKLGQLFDEWDKKSEFSPAERQAAIHFADFALGRLEHGQGAQAEQNPAVVWYEIARDEMLKLADNLRHDSEMRAVLLAEVRCAERMLAFYAHTKPAADPAQPQMSAREWLNKQYLYCGKECQLYDTSTMAEKDAIEITIRQVCELLEAFARSRGEEKNG